MYLFLTRKIPLRFHFFFFPGGVLAPFNGYSFSEMYIFIYFVNNHYLITFCYHFGSFAPLYRTAKRWTGGYLCTGAVKLRVASVLKSPRFKRLCPGCLSAHLPLCSERQPPNRHGSETLWSPCCPVTLSFRPCY